MFQDNRLKKYVYNVLKKDSNSTITLEECQSITELDLSNKGIRSLEGLQYFINMKSLNLRDNKISDLSPIKNALKLEALSFINTKIDKLDDISGLVNLKILYISSNIKDLKPISNLFNLEELYGFETSIKNLNPIRDLKTLKHLILPLSNVSDISPIINLDSLKSLILEGKRIKEQQLLLEFKSLKLVCANDLTKKIISDLEAINCEYSPSYLFVDKLESIDEQDEKLSGCAFFLKSKDLETPIAITAFGFVFTLGLLIYGIVDNTLHNTILIRTAPLILFSLLGLALLLMMNYSICMYDDYLIYKNPLLKRTIKYIDIKSLKYKHRQSLKNVGISINIKMKLPIYIDLWHVKPYKEKAFVKIVKELTKLKVKNHK
ncbi:leucine-rich repeat domain-containing protein [Mycoplasmatota bacterium]|nr:leucine-rich repeat domain-containing protein [Mycoplasmatota bacterium]